MLHFGEKDAHIPADEVREIEARIRTVEFYYLSRRPWLWLRRARSFDAESSAIAWGRTLEFLARHLG